VLGELGVTLWVADVSAERLAWAVRHGVAAIRAVADYRTALNAVGARSTSSPRRRATGTSRGRAWPPAVIASSRSPWRERSRGALLEAAAESTGRVVRVGHVSLPSGDGDLARGARRRRIGAVRYATGRFSIQARPRLDVGVTQTDAIYYFDLFAYLFDRAATSQRAAARLPGPRSRRSVRDRRSLRRRAGGRRGELLRARTWRECVIVGERGTLVADYGASSVTLHLGEHRQRGNTWDAVETGKKSFRRARRASVSSCRPFSSVRWPCGQPGPGVGRRAGSRDRRGGRAVRPARCRRLAPLLS
jgi:hypothetical protein